VLVANPILSVVLGEALHDLRKQAWLGEADAWVLFHQRILTKDDWHFG
jgi:hypothetical protein